MAFLVGLALAACAPAFKADAGRDSVDGAVGLDAPDTALDVPPPSSDVPSDAFTRLAAGAPHEGHLGAGETARYWLDGVAGTWISILITEMATDPTVALTTLAGERIAFCEDFIQTDDGAMLVTQIRESGPLLVEVALETGREGDGRYSIEWGVLGPSEVFTLDLESGDDAANATRFETQFTWLAGSLDHPDDVDVFDLPDGFFVGPGTPIVVMNPTPTGPNGNGSTSTLASIRLLDASGASLAEWIPTGSEEYLELVSPALAGGFVELRGSSAPGDHGLYVIRIFVSRLVPSEG